MQPFENNLFLDSLNSAKKSMSYLENFLETSFFCVLPLDWGIQWRLLDPVDPPHLPGTTSSRWERERARARRAMAVSGTRFQGTEGAFFFGWKWVVASYVSSDQNPTWLEK